MPEGQPKPAPQDVISPPETGSTEDLGNIITSLVEQQAISHYKDSNEEKARYNSIETNVYNLLIDLRVASPDIWHDTVANVFTAYGSLIYDDLPLTKKALFLYDARNEQAARGTDLVLTAEEGGILQNIARAVGVEYDPGAAENTEQKTFRLADVEAKAPDPSELPTQFRRYFSEIQE